MNTTETIQTATSEEKNDVEDIVVEIADFQNEETSDCQDDETTQITHQEAIPLKEGQEESFPQTTEEKHEDIASSRMSSMGGKKNLISQLNIVLFVILLISIGYTFYTASDKPRNVKLSTRADSLSYALGYLYGMDLVEIPYDFDMKMFYRGIVNVANPNISVLSEEQIMALLRNFSDEMSQIFMQDQRELFFVNVETGRAFMETNSLNPEVTTTDSGLQYRVITVGTGRRPTVNGTVEAHYTGKFLSGEIFDSSHFRGAPIVFDIEEVIEGWQEALLLMREGDVYELVLPYHLAYGEEGFEIIEPGATLIFEIELISVVR